MIRDSMAASVIDTWGELEAASQSAQTIVKTALEKEVRTIAIPVVKLDGKALGIVQLDGTQEGMASIETGIQGQVWEQTSSVAEVNSQPASRLGG